MRYLVTGKEMKLLDKNTSDCFKVPELVLMEQAALGFVQELLSLLQQNNKKASECSCLVFCGTGNNGADGIAIARLLNERGISTYICKCQEVYHLDANTSESYDVQNRIYTEYRYPVITTSEELDTLDVDVVIDAVFGVGLSRMLSEAYMDIINTINRQKGIKIAVDIPSGIHSDNGQIMGACVDCDYTYTFSFEKLGMYLWPGNAHVGAVRIIPIGITKRSWLTKKPSMATLEMSDLLSLPIREDHSNKGTFGRLLIIAGSKDMAGAAILSAKAAYRCGVGLVRIFTPEENRMIVQTAIPEAVLSTYNNKVDKESLVDCLKWADAVLIGPGLSTSKTAKELVEIVRSTAAVPVVWDADALNIIAENSNSFLLPHTESIITPHLGEFSRLINNSVSWIQNHLVESAVEYARTYDVICVLKDYHTVIANPYGLGFLNLSGNNGMATAGSGDVLAGMIASLLAQGIKAIDAASFGVFLHGLAGDEAKTYYGEHGMIASDIVDGLVKVWNKLENRQ